MKKIPLLLAGVALLWTSVSASVSVLPKEVDLQWLSEALAKSNALIVFEGLPHQAFESKSRALEIKRVPTLVIGGQFLYARPLEISADDRHRLAEIFVPARVLIAPPITGLSVKFCGGFHADYAIRWEKDGSTLFYSLICFSCGELRLVDGDVVVTADMTKEGRTALAKILIPHRQERPAFRQDKSEEAKPILPEPPKVEYKS